MRFWRSIGLLALALGVLALPARAADSKSDGKAPKTAADSLKAAKAAAPRGPRNWLPDRRAWSAGITVGAGSAAFQGEGRQAFFGVGPDGFSTSDREMGTIVGFRLGYSIRPGLGLGFQRRSWTKTINGDDWSFGLSTMNLTWYPRGRHFYLRGGVGVGDATDKDVLDQLTGRNIRYTDDGFGALLVAGCEWRIYKRLAMSPQIEASYLSLDRKVSANIGAASMAVDWWF